MTRIFVDPLWSGDKSLPILAFRNAFRQATYSGASVAGLALSARSPFTYNFWEGGDGQQLVANRGAAGTVDYIGLYYRGATFETGASLTFHYFNGVSWVAISTPITLDRAEGCFLFIIPQVTDAEQIRVTVGGGVGNTVKVCNFKAGVLLSLPTGLPIGYEPGVLNLDTVTTNVESEEGQLLGSNVQRSGVNEGLNFAAIDQDWIRLNWQPYQEELRKEGIYFAWYPDAFEDDLLYGMILGRPRVRYSSVRAQDISLELRGPNNGIR